MLARQHRLHSSSDFTRVVRRGRRADGGVLVVHTAAGASSSTRVGLIVSKSVGNSVVRHRVSRRLRAVLSAHIDVFAEASDVVVRALPAAGQATSAELSAGLERALRAYAGRRGKPSARAARVVSAP